MLLKERLIKDLKEAMKSRNQVWKNVITLIRSDINQIEIDKRIKLQEKDIIDIISRQMKQIKDALEEFEKAEREDLIKQTKEEIQYLLEYLPEQLSKEELSHIVRETIAEIGANSMKDMGKVMAATLPKIKGRADGKTVNQIVRQQLQ